MENPAQEALPGVRGANAIHRGSHHSLDHVHKNVKAVLFKRKIFLPMGGPTINDKVRWILDHMVVVVEEWTMVCGSCWLRLHNPTLSRVMQTEIVVFCSLFPVVIFVS